MNGDERDEWLPADPEALAMLWTDWWLNAPMSESALDENSCIDDFMVFMRMLREHGFEIFVKRSEESTR